MYRKFGINIVSLFPWSWGKGGPQRCMSMATQAGFNGIQYLPMRGWGKVNGFEPKIISFEDAWNWGPWWKVPRRLIGLDEDAPRLLDWLVFRQSKSPNFGNAIPTKHFFSTHVVTEIHPELSTDPDVYSRLAVNGSKFCWDTHHATRRTADGKEGLRSWRNLLRELVQLEAISLIHLHLTREEIPDFLASTGDSIEMLETLRYTDHSVPVIVEIAPPMMSYVQSVKFFKKLLQTTRKLMLRF